MNYSMNHLQIQITDAAMRQYRHLSSQLAHDRAYIDKIKDMYYDRQIRAEQLGIYERKQFKSEEGWQEFLTIKNRLQQFMHMI